ncbi:unnamed protein product [Spirodela intermedia]|uniref:Uncharacterized protein n=1 Tax=Spirodela intermedia TaxID=51605 RepID=A0A7I8J3L9_SPIIN|nr:unnamed protein product [Spirodela intermedia]CAA6664650.1 unnamed protein product [Spirodela intermedia]
MYSWMSPDSLLVAVVVAASAAAARFFALPLLKRTTRIGNGISLRLPPNPPGLPILGNLRILGALPHRALRKLAEAYGPVMGIRLGLVQAVVVSSFVSAQKFLREPAFMSRPAGDVSNYLTYGRKGVLSSECGSNWRESRNLCLDHMLSTRSIDALRGVRNEEIHRLLYSLKKAADGDCKAVDLSEAVTATILAIVCRTLFGKVYGNASAIEKTLKEATQLTGVFNINDYIPFIGFLDLNGHRRRMKAVRRAYDSLFETVIHKHCRSLNEGTKLEDCVVASILSSTGTQYDRVNLKAILMDMITGGSDTSATTVEWTMSELLRHPRVMRKLQHELEEAVGMDRVVEEEDLPKLPYLEMARVDCVAGGFQLKKGSQVLVNLWAVGRDPSQWDDPEAFYPERFEGSDFLAFGAGNRRCPGMQMGLTTVRIVVAQLVHCFDWALPGDLDMSERFGIRLSRAKNLLAVPTYRLPPGS